MRFDAELGTVRRWVRQHKDNLFDGLDELEAAVDLDLKNYARAWQKSATLRAEDRRLARDLSIVLSKDSPHVKDLRADIAEAEEEENEKGLERKKYPTAGSSGYRMWHLMIESEVVKSGAGQGSRVKKFRGKEYFNMGMTETEYKLAVIDLKEEHALLPAEERKRDNDLILTLLEKMPVAVDELKKKYSNEILEARAMREEFKRSYKQMGRILAPHITGEADDVLLVNRSTS